MASTVELVEKLKAQLAESREDLVRKDRLASPESNEVASIPKDMSTLLAGSDSESFIDLRQKPEVQEEVQSQLEELRQRSNELTVKMTNLTSNTRQLFSQLLREREDRLAFQHQVSQRLGDAQAQDEMQLAQRPKTHVDLLESSVVALREDLEHLSRQSQILQQEFEASLHSMELQLGAVVSWVQEKLEMQLRTKDNICLSPIMEDRGEESPGQVLPRDNSPQMFQVLRNIADEMPAIVKQMAEKTQVLVTRVEHEHAERVAREAQIEEVLRNLSQKVGQLYGSHDRGRDAEGTAMSTLRLTEPIEKPHMCFPGPVLLNSAPLWKNGRQQLASDFKFEVKSQVGNTPFPPFHRMVMEKTQA